MYNEMIYSMTMYYNEPEIIDLKIKEETPYVDKIIIQESLWSHAGNLKPINFDAVKYRDNKKIIHLVIDNTAPYADCDIAKDRFSRANAERRYPLSVLAIEDDDILIVTDSDEIVNGEEITRIIRETKTRGFVRLGMRAFYYYINVIQANEWSYPYAVNGKIAKKFGLDWLRLNMTGIVLKNCGNHFGWLGNPDAIKNKIQNMAHTEFNTKKIVDETEKRMEQLEDVVGRTDQGVLKVIPIDHLYPRTILNNYAEWKKYVK
jgi:hypothetical protein